MHRGQERRSKLGGYEVARAKGASGPCAEVKGDRSELKVANESHGARDGSGVIESGDAGDGEDRDTESILSFKYI